MNQFYYSPFVPDIVPGALTAYDLPDLAATLAPRKLMLAGTTDGNNKKTDKESIDEDLAIIKTAYQAQNASGQLKIVTTETTEKPNNLFIEWIK